MGRRQLPLGIAAGLLAACLVPLRAVEADPGETVAPLPRSVWLYEVDASALPEAEFRLDHILGHLSASNSPRMTDSEVRVHIIPQDQNVTDLPLWSNLRGLRLPDVNPGDGYQEARGYDDVRGLGPAVCSSGPLDIAIGEELVVFLPDGRHRSPAPEQVGWSLVHEIGHAAACSMTDAQKALLADSYAAARVRPLTDVVGSYPAYTVADQREYFAEGTVAWFEAGPNQTYRRDWLSAHDPGLHQLMSEVFVVPALLPTCAGRRATAVVAAGAGPFLGTPGPDVVVGSPTDDVINGGGGHDVICGGDGNDTLLGSYGGDQILGGPGDDRYEGGSDDDTLDDAQPGDSGADTIDGGPGDDRLAGGAGADYLVDSVGGDELVGGDGDDILDSRDAAESSPDVVDGSQPVDTCHHDADDQVTGCGTPAR